MSVRGLLGVGCASFASILCVASCASDPQPGIEESQGIGRADTAVFAGNGAGVPVTIDGVDRDQQLPIGDEVKALLGEMTAATDQNVKFLGTIYELATLDRDRFDDKLNCFAVRTNMVFDMLFRSDGSRPDAPQPDDLSFATKFETEFDSFKCTQLKATTTGRHPQSLLDKAIARYHGFTAFVIAHGDTSVPKTTRDKLSADADAAVTSMMSGADAKSKVYSCHWDNNDDTEMDGLIRIDAKQVDDANNSQIRVLSAFAGG
jgi:hypothetical protein